MEVQEFLNKEQEQRVINAIQKAEKKTSGEIRVHFERNTKKDALIRAEEVFYGLEMDKTNFRNGILFYVAVDDHQFAIVGDEGIDKVVPDDFWESIKDEVLSEFSNGDHARGLELGILHTGEKLKEFFPVADDDDNELSDEISKGF